MGEEEKVVVVVAPAWLVESLLEAGLCTAARLGAVGSAEQPGDGAHIQGARDGASSHPCQTMVKGDQQPGGQVLW